MNSINSFLACGKRIPSLRSLNWRRNRITPLVNVHFCREPTHCQIRAVHLQSSRVETLLLASGKAPGVDKIPIRVIKDCLPAILSALTSIINETFESDIFPMAWKVAEVIPILKNGDPPWNPKQQQTDYTAPSPVKSLRACSTQSIHVIFACNRSFNMQTKRQ